jgi:poly-gamma-glutamate capsule biosynthesis protein CapA/YwtB (metallophosphatase superfamily)
MSRRILACAVALWLCGCRSPAPGWNQDRTEGNSSTGIASAVESKSPPTEAEIRPTSTQESAPGPEPTTSPTRTPSEIPRAVLAFVGDVMLGRSLGERIKRGEGDTIFASVESTLQSVDLTVGNLECAMGEGGQKAKKYYAFLAPPQSAALLKKAGFGLLSLANNHSFDFGTGVFEQTVSLLDENGISYVGAGSDEVRAHAPVILSIRGIRLAFLAYVDVAKEYIGGFDPKVWTAGPATPGVAWAEDEKIKQDLQSVDPDVDFTVVLFHFGDEGMDTPNPRQIQLSRLAVEYGADLVVGSHPHVLQPMDEYKGGLIFYSLGNFVFDEFDGDANHSAILRITVSKNGPPEYSLLLLNIVDGIPRIGE